MKTSREVTIYDLFRPLNFSPSKVSRELKDNPSVKLRDHWSDNHNTLVLKHHLIIRKSSLRNVNVRP